MQKIVGIDFCLFKDCAQSPLRHITGMIGNGCKTVSDWVMPNFVAACSMAIKGESKSAQLLNDLCIFKTGQPAHY
jgi:hypothetical protein